MGRLQCGWVAAWAGFEWGSCDVGVLQCGGILERGNFGAGSCIVEELWRGVVAVCVSCSIRPLRCIEIASVGVKVFGSCSVGEF